MTTHHVFNPKSPLGLQIIHNNHLNDQYILSSGHFPNSSIEISLNTSNLSLSADNPNKHIHFSLCNHLEDRETSSNGRDPINRNTLKITFAKPLFSLFTVQQQFKNAHCPLEVFKNDLHLLNNTMHGIIHPKFSFLLNNTIELIKRPEKIADQLSKNIQMLAQVIIAANKRTIDQQKNDIIIMPVLVQVINNVIENDYTYPASSTIQRITQLPKKQFEKEIKRSTSGSLKTFQSELQFKSSLYQILSTQMKFKEIALEHGFSDHSAFTRSIRSKTGYAPKILRMYRKKGIFKLLPIVYDHFPK